MAKRSSDNQRKSKRSIAESTVPAKKQARRNARKSDEANERSANNPLVFKSEAQREFVSVINAHQLTIGIGPAGTGKTYLAAKLAAQALDRGTCKGILIVRPIVESGTSMGFLPGDTGEKTAPYQVPVLEALGTHFGASHLDNLINGPHPKVEFIAPNFIRGRTFEDKFIILDEAQNMTPHEMKTFLTRIGMRSKVVVSGDVDQVDIKGKSGLVDAIEKLNGLDAIGFFEFSEDDIVRSGLVKDIVKRYRSRSLDFKKVETPTGQN